MAYIYLDEQIIDFVNLKSVNNHPEIVFSSPDLEYGEHKLRIETAFDGFVVIGSIYVDPLPSSHSFVVGASGFTILEEQWKIDSTSTPPMLTSGTSDSASVYFEFYAKRFWLTEYRTNSIGNFGIFIDGGEVIQITGSKSSKCLSDNKAVLFYDSGETLDFKMHTLTIARTSQPVSIMNLLYIWYPYTSTPAPSPTSSDDFSFSDQFSDSTLFSYSQPFSYSISFSDSKTFSNSEGFIRTEEFSVSERFSASEMFSNSELFSHSQYFTESAQFRESMTIMREVIMIALQTIILQLRMMTKLQQEMTTILQLRMMSKILLK